MNGASPHFHPTEDAAAVPPAAAGLAALFSGRILRDGETILLVLKPSLWFIVLQSLRFAAVAALFALAAALIDGRMEQSDRVFFEVAVVFIAVRLMWASLNWMGRLYVLTDQRMIRISGIFSIEVYDCPLRKVGEARLTANFREIALGLGTIDIFPSDPERLPASWQTIPRPRQVHAEVLAAISRAKQ